MPNNLRSSRARATPALPMAPMAPMALAALAAAGALLGPRAARAQVSAAVDVAAIVGTPVTVTGDAPLDFTTVFAGTAKTVSPTAGGATGATAGRFSIVGKNKAEVLIMFALPASLKSGANNLPIDSWQGCLNQLDTTVGCVAFVPSAGGTTANLSTGGGSLKSLYIWVGATVRPTPTQPGGAYTAPMALTAVYTGF